MQSPLPIYPEQASNFAPHVDALMVFISGICLLFGAGITTAIVVFFFKYHRKEQKEKPSSISQENSCDIRDQFLINCILNSN